MDKLKVLVLGDGLLGSELVKQTGWEYLSRKRNGFNIKNVESIPVEYGIIVNCIANTDTYSNDRKLHWETNYQFVNDLINFTNKNGIKLIHISTDYVYSGSIDNASENDVPVHCNNWYGYTKLLSDGLVQLLSKNYLLCRCTHKPNPFPYESAWIDQIGNFDYVNNISSIIIDMIRKDLSGVYNVGTELKTMYQLASSTRGVNPIFSPKESPKNTSMSLEKLQKNLPKRPFFSIAIPAYGYNGKGRDFLDFNFSILYSQIFKDFEVVVSDHSIDDTIKDLCDEWSGKLNIRYLRNEIGRGVISPNLNVALKNCRGEWIKILFQDDFLYDCDALDVTKDFIKCNADAIWIATKFCHTKDGVNMYRELYPIWDDRMTHGQNSIGCPSVISIKNENILLFNEELNWLMDCEYYRRMYDLYGEPYLLPSLTVVNRSNDGDRLTDTIPHEEKMAEVEKLKLIYG